MKIDVETRIQLDELKLRRYQLPIQDAIENKGYRKVVAILPRRAGKEVTSLFLAIRQCIKEPCVVYYIYPTYSRGRKILWDSLTNDGKRFLDYIPRQLVASMNQQEMKIRFTNGSLIQIIGSDNPFSIVGTNPKMIIFSEYAEQDPMCFQLAIPILTANDGIALFISTPRGKNHFWELYNIALASKDWFAYKLSIEDTQHIPINRIYKDIADGVISEDLAQQEYFCSFDLGVEGSYYSKYIDKMHLKGQIGCVPWEVGLQVHTAWDIGVRDNTCIIFFQIAGQVIRIIDYYEKSKEGLEHYVNVIKSKPYNYGIHLAPHDIAVKEFGSGMTRIEKARQLGIEFTIANNVSIMDGIESVRSTLGKVWIDEHSCKDLIKALENYRQEYDSKRQCYKDNPMHNWASHACFTANTLILTHNGMQPIIDVKENDLILTLKGWKKCLKSGLTIKDAKLVEVKFKDGLIVKCTPDHLFLTESGWKSAKSLTQGSEIQSSLMNWFSTLMEDCISFGQMKDITPEEEKRCIVRYGQMLLGLYRQILISIIETGIQGIIPYQTSNVLQKKSISEKRDQIIKDLLLQQGLAQQLGILLQTGFYGTFEMLRNVQIGINGQENREIVCTAAKNLIVLLEKMDSSKSSVIQTVKPLTIESVDLLETTEDVYDIEVEDAHHFSLSNGAIVHNSDAMRYLCVSLSKLTLDTSAEDLEKRYRSVVYGEPDNMPGFFKDKYHY